MRLVVFVFIEQLLGKKVRLSSLFDVVAEHSIIGWIWIMLTKRYSLHAVLHHNQYWPCTFNNSTSLVFKLLDLMLMALDFFLQTLNLFLVVVDLLLVVFP